MFLQIAMSEDTVFNANQYTFDNEIKVSKGGAGASCLSACGYTPFTRLF